MASKTQQNETSFAIAKKHVELSLKVKRIAQSKGYGDNVFITTHALRRSALPYREAEKASGEDFYSIKGWIPSSPKAVNLKDPDLIITDESRVKYFIEVKWGKQEDPTDLKLGTEERRKIANLLAAGSRAFCNINGPVSKPRSEREAKTFPMANDAMFILVTDIPSDSYSQSLLLEWQEAGLRVVDIEKPMGTFALLGEVLDASK
jgi:hypothetical protein